MTDVKNVLLDSPYGTTLKEIVEYCVTLTSAALLTQLQAADQGITGIYFKHGHILEIVSELEALSKGPATKSQRYPLVALLRDFPELNGALPGIDSQNTLNLIIAIRTERTYTADKREALSFTPILKPIVAELLHQFEMSGKFMAPGQDQQNYLAIERYFWGRESISGAKENIFNDWIDCIEIKNLNLKLYSYGR